MNKYIYIPIHITEILPELAGKKVTLSYSPATPEDEAVINSYLPKPHADGTPIDPSELPTSLPAYLINVKPELRIDGEVVATGTVVGLGTKESFRMGFSGPSQSPDVVSSIITAGEYYGIGIDTGRISEGHLQAVKTKLEATKAKLESGDYTGLTKDDILGDLLYTTALSYFVELDAMNHVQAKTMKVASVRLPSQSFFLLKLDTYSIFGIPQSVSAEGLMMDVGRNINMVKALDGDNAKKVQYVLASGMNSSALEHSVPEQMFSTPDNPADGVSAVKALKIANDQGIPIYTINQSNIDTILPQLQVDPDVKADIVNAVNAGKVVTVSKTNITFNGWTGCGYIIIDPTTGNGAYMISGGMNGAIVVLWILIGTLFLFSFVLLTATFTVLVSLLLPVYISLQAWLTANSNIYKFKAFLKCLTDAIAIHIIYDSVTLTIASIIKNLTEILIRVIELGNLIMLGYLVYEVGECIHETFH
jgi:hypothetical protein